MQGCSLLNTSIQYLSGSLIQDNDTVRKRNDELDWRETNLPCQQWHDFLQRKSQGIYRITPKTSK